MVIGTFALFLKTDNETIFMSFFSYFSHKFKLLDKVEIDIALTGTWEKFYFCLLLWFFFFTFFSHNISARLIFQFI